MDPKAAANFILHGLWRMVREEQPDAEALNALEKEITELKFEPFPVRNLSFEEFSLLLHNASRKALVANQSKLAEINFNLNNLKMIELAVQKGARLDFYPMLKCWNQRLDETYPAITPLQLFEGVEKWLVPPNTIILNPDEYWLSSNWPVPLYENIPWGDDGFDIQVQLYEESAYGNIPAGIHRYGYWTMKGEFPALSVSEIVRIFKNAPGAEMGEEIYNVGIYRRIGIRPNIWDFQIYSIQKHEKETKLVKYENEGYITFWDNRSMESYFNEDDLDRVKSWSDYEMEPSITPLEARDTLLRYVRDSLGLEIDVTSDSISLNRHYPTNKWFYNILLGGSPKGKINTINGFVLMDGTVIPFTEKDTSGMVIIKAR